MQIEFIYRSPNAIENHDHKDAVVIRVDEVDYMEFYDGEPEDNTLARNFSDVVNIRPLIEKVIDAVKDGELIEITERNSDDI